MQSTTQNLPADFVEVYVNGKTGLVRREGSPAIINALLHGQGCKPLKMLGRGQMWQFSWAGGRTGVIRKYMRGGLMRFILRDRYPLFNRPLREFRAHLAVLARGLPAPEILGVSWKRKYLFYTGALATEKLSGKDLDAWLRASEPDTEKRREILQACGVVVKRMHDAGISHADLQVKNILVTCKGPVLLDFDRARIGASPGKLRRAASLLRLRRSFAKRGHADCCFAAFMEGYGAVPFPRWLVRLYGVRGRVSDMIRGRRREQL